MRHKPLGRSALTVSAVGLGCNNFGRRLDRAGTRAVIDAARLARLRAARGRSLLELAVAALASQPVVASVIAGAMRPEQVAANATAGEWQLRQDDLAALAEL